MGKKKEEDEKKLSEEITKELTEELQREPTEDEVFQVLVKKELQAELKRDPNDAEIAVRADKKKDERKAQAALDKERAEFAKQQKIAKAKGFAQQGLAYVTGGDGEEEEK